MVYNVAMKVTQPGNQLLAWHVKNLQPDTYAIGRVEKSKNGFGSYGYYFLNGFWYIENGGNFFFGIREYLDKWNFT